MALVVDVQKQLGSFHLDVQLEAEENRPQAVASH